MRDSNIIKIDLCCVPPCPEYFPNNSKFYLDFLYFFCILCEKWNKVKCQEIGCVQKKDAFLLK